MKKIILGSQSPRRKELLENAGIEFEILTADGEEIVPFGKYEWIDGFDKGYARVKNGKQSSNLKDNDNKWGLINEIGEEVLPAEYDSIWNFYNKDWDNTIIVKSAVSTKFFFNKKRFIAESNDFDYDYDDYGTHYGEYAGTYAQDVMGYSDDVINDAFDGEADAYWNID